MLNQYTVAKGQNLSYDGNGNLSNDGTNSYVYDAANRLISASGAATASYVYDPFSRRASKTVNGTTTNYLYDGDQVIAEYDGAGTILRKFVYGPGIDEPIFMEGVDNRYYYHADALGSVIGLTNNSGAFAETYAYSAWGQVTNLSTVGNPFMYTGRRYDTETGLYYYRARQYSADLRRFLQPDPIGFAGGMNLYAYVGNSPWNFVDPWGLEPCSGESLKHCQAYCSSLGFSIRGCEVTIKDEYTYQTCVCNKPCELFNMERHHLLPRQFMFFFAKAGLNVEQFVICIPKERHRLKPGPGLHTKFPGPGLANWNTEWNRFISNNPTADRDDIHMFLFWMIARYDLRGYL